MQIICFNHLEPLIVSLTLFLPYNVISPSVSPKLFLALQLYFPRSSWVTLRICSLIKLLQQEGEPSTTVLMYLSFLKIRIIIPSPGVKQVLRGPIVSSTDFCCLITPNLKHGNWGPSAQIGRGNKKIPLNFNEDEVFSIHFPRHKTSRNHKNILTWILNMK